MDGDGREGQEKGGEGAGETRGGEGRGKKEGKECAPTFWVMFTPQLAKLQTEATAHNTTPTDAWLANWLVSMCFLRCTNLQV